MLILLAAIFCSVAVSVLLKMARQGQIRIAQSIVVNYVVAAGLTALLLRPELGVLRQPSVHWLLLLALGLLLPSVFVLMAKAVVVAGIALSDAAQRLSLFIPLLLSFVLFAQQPEFFTVLGVVLALLAMVLLVYRPARGQGVAGASGLWLLLGVWCGYGVIDVLFKRMALTGAQFSASLLAAFVLSGLLLLSWLLLRKERWHRPSLLLGILLGGLNFGNIYAYILAHQHFSAQPALVFAAMNMGVICLGAVVGVWLFHERLSRLNLAGILLALLAIASLLAGMSG